MIRLSLFLLFIVSAASCGSGTSTHEKMESFATDASYIPPEAGKPSASGNTAYSYSRSEGSGRELHVVDVPLEQKKSEQEVQTSRVEANKQMLIRNATVRYEVSNLDKGIKEVENKVKSLGGYISNSSQHNYSYNLQAGFTIRIQAAKLDTLLNTLLKNANKVTCSVYKKNAFSVPFLCRNAGLIY